jgi:hypothetical protein
MIILAARFLGFDHFRECSAAERDEIRAKRRAVSYMTTNINYAI